MPAFTHDDTGPFSMAHIQDGSYNALAFFGGVISCPVECFTRVSFGTNYIPLPVLAASTAMMLLIPAVLAVLTAIWSLIPFGHPTPSSGLISFGNFTEAYLIALAVHLIRLSRRMINPHTELFSYYEGPPLFFFAWVPWCRSVWTTRIVVEPVFIVLCAIVLRDLYIIESSLAIFWAVAALGLCIKNFVAWSRSWRAIRRILDATNSGPILARIASNDATDDEAASINMGSFPKDISPEVRAEAAAFIARAYTPAQD